MNEPLELTNAADVSVLNAGPDFSTDKRTAAVSSQNIASLAKTGAIKAETTLYNPVGPMPDQQVSTQVPGVPADMLNEVNAFMNGTTPASSMPAMETPVAPEPAMPAVPTMETPVAPEPAMPTVPTMETPVAPEPAMPTVPTMETPVASEPAMPAVPTVETPFAPEPAMPAVPTMETPVAPEPAMPAVPAVETPVAPEPAVETQKILGPLPSEAATNNNKPDMYEEIETIRDMLSLLHDNLDELDDKFAALERNLMNKAPKPDVKNENIGLSEADMPRMM